jgi:hypothetical protein
MTRRDCVVALMTAVLFSLANDHIAAAMFFGLAALAVGYV